MSSGTSYQIDIDAPSASAEAAADATGLLAVRLAEAGTASTAASEAVKAAEAAYKATEVTADRAAKALEKITVAADAQRGKLAAAMDAGDAAGAEKAAKGLSNLLQRQDEAAKKAAQAAAAMNSESEALEHLDAVSAQAKKDHEQLSKAQDHATEAAKAMADAESKAAGSGDFNKLADGAKKLGGPLGKAADVAGDVSEGFEKMSGSIGTVGAVAAAAAVAVAALTVAVAAGAFAAVKWAIGMSDAARSAKLLSDGIAGSVAGGRELDAAIKSLESQVPQTSDELQSMAADLAKTGLKGQALTDALEETATKAAKLKFGPDFAKEANSLTKISARLQKNFGSLFGGLNLDAMLAGFGKIVDLFDETSVTGKAIKVVFESLFQPIVDGLTALAPMIVKTFIQFEIWALKALIAIKPYKDELLLIVEGFGVLAAAVGVAIAVVVAALAGAAVSIAAVVAAGLWLSQTFEGFGKSIREFFVNLSLETIGTDLVAGLAKGISAGGTMVLGAITGVVDGAIGAAKSLLGIKSPSTVFADIGANTAAGMAGGVEGGTSQVQGSLETMVSPPADTGGAPAAGGSGGGTYYLTFQFDGGDPKAGAQAAMDKFVEFFEGINAQLGGEVPA